MVDKIFDDLWPFTYGSTEIQSNKFEAFYNETVEVAENMDNATAEHFFMFLTLIIFGGLVFLYRLLYHLFHYHLLLYSLSLCNLEVSIIETSGDR